MCTPKANSVAPSPQECCAIQSQPEDFIRDLLASCQPSMEYLLPICRDIGLNSKRDLDEVLSWGNRQRILWLKEVESEERGLSRLNVKSLSLAFQVWESANATSPDLDPDQPPVFRCGVPLSTRRIGRPISGPSAITWLTRGPSMTSTHYSSTSRDAAISSEGYLHPGDQAQAVEVSLSGLR